MSTPARTWSRRHTIAANVRNLTLVLGWSVLLAAWMAGQPIPGVALAATTVAVGAANVAVLCDWLAARALWAEVSRLADDSRDGAA